MSSKKIILSSNVGNIPNIITSGKNGLLFKSENEDDLVSQLIFIANNKTECDTIILNAFVFVQKHYSWDVISERVLDVYKKSLVMDSK